MNIYNANTVKQLNLRFRHLEDGRVCMASSRDVPDCKFYYPTGE